VRFLVLALACGLSFLLYLHRYAWGFIKKDVQEEFGWGPVTLGWLDGMFPLTYGVGQVPAGMLCDWFGARVLLGGSVLVWSASLAGLALATGLASMAAARLIFGAAQASCYPILSKVSKNWFPPSMRTTAQGLIATFFGRCGGAASFLLFGPLLLGWFALTWREAVLLLSGLGLVAGVVFLVLFRNTPREHPSANEAEADLITAGDPEAAHGAGSRVRWSALLRNPSVLFLLLRAVLSNLADVLYVNWLPFYLRTEMDLNVAKAGWLAALPLLGGAIGGACSGALQSWLIHLVGYRWARSGVALAGKSLAAILMLTVLGLESAVVVCFIFLAVKFFSDWEQPAEWGAATDLGGRSAATVFACVNTAGSLGGFLAGPLIGLVLSHFSVNGIPTASGWNAVFLLIAAEYLAAAVCWLFIECRLPSAPNEERK
jgi:ACS family glucarate transporter-like MFS transporter